jgi:hypothetical protein
MFALMAVMEQIQYVGAQDLDAMKKRVLNKLSSEYHEKIRRSLHNITTLIVHIKVHEKGGKAVKYSIHVKAVAPTVVITSTKASDWDFARTLHKAFKDLENQISKRFKTYKKGVHTISKVKVKTI